MKTFQQKSNSIKRVIKRQEMHIQKAESLFQEDLKSLTPFMKYAS